MEVDLTLAGRLNRRPISDIGLAVAVRHDFCPPLAIPSFDISFHFVKIVKMGPRTRILDAAMLVFRRQGFRRSSIEQAAEAAGLTRQALHAFRLGFAHPVTGEPMAFRSPPPPDLLQGFSEWGLDYNPG